MANIKHVNSVVDRDFRNRINQLIDVVNSVGISIDELVVKGVMTTEQYSQLITAINGLVKIGEINLDTLSNDLKSEIEKINSKLDKGNVSVTDINKNLGKIDQTFLSDELLQQIAGTAPINAVVADGSVTKVKVAPKAIDSTRTNFAGKGKNLWDGSFETGIVLNGSPGGIGRIQENANGVMAFIEVEPESTVTIWTNGDTDRFRIATSEKRLGVGESVTRYLYSYDTHAKNEATVTLSSNERFIIVYLSSEGKTPSELQVEKGNSRTTYESPEKVTIKFAEKSIPKNALNDEVFNDLSGENLSDKSVSPNKTTFAKPGRNLFNGDFKKGFSLVFNSANKYVFGTTENKGVVTVDRITPGENYTVSKKPGTSNRLIIASYENKPQIGSESLRTINSDITKDIVTFTAGAKENYIVVYVSINDNYKLPEEFQIEKGNEKTDYVKPNAVEIELANAPTAIVQTPDKKINLTHVLRSNYDTQSEYISPYTNDVNFLYGLYDESVSANSDYVIKTVLGHESTGIPIHQYDFKPPEPKYAAGVSGEYKKIIVVSSIHGMEKHAAIGTAKFFKALCDDWRNDPVLELLRWNFHFIVIPALNPWGYNANERKNSNGVDLNRNFPNGWRTGNDPSARDYPGPSPASEIETQLMQQVIANNKDALFMFDHHNSGGWDFNRYVVWSGSNDRLIRGMLNSFNHFIAGQMKRKFSYLPENESLQYLSSPVDGGLARYVYGEGIDSALLESAVGLSSEHETQILNENTVGNLLVSVVKNYS